LEMQPVLQEVLEVKSGVMHWQIGTHSLGLSLETSRDF
jgi:hypothetical protein